MEKSEKSVENVRAGYREAIGSPSPSCERAAPVQAEMAPVPAGTAPAQAEAVPVQVEAAPAQEAVPADKKKSPGIFSVFFSVIFSLLLSISTALLMPLLFVHALSEKVKLPSLGPVSGDLLAVLFDSGYALILGGGLAALLLLLLALINTHRIRRFFLFVGISAMISALSGVVFGFAGKHVIKMFSGEWQDILIHTTSTFREFTAACVMALVVVGATCLSVYSCIAAVKGARHEKTA